MLISYRTPLACNFLPSIASSTGVLVSESAVFTEFQRSLYLGYLQYERPAPIGNNSLRDGVEHNLGSFIGIRHTRPRAQHDILLNGFASLCIRPAVRIISTPLASQSVDGLRKRFRHVAGAIDMLIQKQRDPGFRVT